MASTQLQLREMALPIGSLDAYIYQINRVPMLSLEEEVALAKQFKENKDLNAARKLILPHLRFVAKIARGYMGYGLSLGDLIQEGNVGLLKAIKRFDPAVGVRLVTFAVHWIKAEIREFVLRNWRIVKIATTKAQRKLFFNLRKMKKRLGWCTKEEIDYVAETLNVKPKTVLEMESRLNSNDSAFDTVAYGEEETASPVHYLSDDSADPAMILEKNDYKENNSKLLYSAFSKLDKRSRDILQKRWLTDNKSKLQDLAEQYNISAERVRQIESSAISKLKYLMQEEDAG